MNSRHAAHSVALQKMQHRPLTSRIFLRTQRKKQFCNCARVDYGTAANRFLSLFKRQNYPSAKLILNKILMRLQRRLHALFAAAADANGSIQHQNRECGNRRATQGHVCRAPCTPSDVMCALCFVIQFNVLGMTRYSRYARASFNFCWNRSSAPAINGEAVIWTVMRLSYMYVNIIPLITLLRARRHVRVVISLIHLSARVGLLAMVAYGRCAADTIFNEGATIIWGNLYCDRWLISLGNEILIEAIVVNCNEKCEDISINWNQVRLNVQDRL